MKNPKIPTIVGTILLLIILYFGVWLSTRVTNTGSKASGDCNPTSLQVTNLTNKSVDISFLTSASCASTLNINSKTIANFKSKSTTHYFRVDGLSASTQYQYSFVIDGNSLSKSEYSFKTAPLPSGNLSTANLAWGKIKLASGQPSVDTIIYLNIAGAWPLSALTDSNGQWHISMSNSFADDKNSLFIPPANGSEDIIIYSTDGQLTQVENSLAKNDPVPDIIIGVGFDTSNFGTGPGTSITPTIVVATPTSFSVGIGGLLSIDSPKEGESITALKPDIFGSGKSNSVVNLSIDSDIVGKTTSKTDGTWHWSPDKNLSLGKHILTVTLGTELLQRNFTIVTPNSSTSPLSFSATPSATIVPTFSPTIIPTLVPTVRTSKPSTKTGIPVTGNTSPLYLLLLSSLFTLSFSLYFFNRNEK